MVLSAIHGNPYQQTKLLNPVQVPMCNILIGKPWEMLAADILEVPILHNTYYNSHGLFY